MSKSEEQWKPIPGYDGFYEVSDMGRVRGRAQRLIKTKPTNKTEQYYVFLKEKGRSVRLLVAEAFVEPFSGDNVEHLNGDVTDNRAENLRWVCGVFVDLEGEEWRFVHDWYDVSNMGRVRSWKSPFFHGRRLNVPIVLKPVKGIRGYSQVMFGKEQPRVHVLVAKAFLGDLPDGMEVNHKNSDRSDNRLENLEYLTHRRNMIHGLGRWRDLPTGVYDKGDFYQVLIRYKGKLIHLGVCKDVSVAERLYLKALDQIERGCFSPKRIKEKLRRCRRWAS